ncbi:hypothetical protein BDW72DRAFT_198033 [Aspergillus terricola var. indicus]
MASQENRANLLAKPSQRSPGRSRPDPERYQIPPFSSQRCSPQTPFPSSCPVELVGVSRTGLTCPRCRASRGHRPDCPQLNTIHEREALKECGRVKTAQQARYEASLVFSEPVDAAYGLATRPVGSVRTPSPTWSSPVINIADDAPSLLPLWSTTATPATPSDGQHVPATLAGLRGEEVIFPSTLSLQHEDRFAALSRSVINRRPTPFAPPDAHPRSPSSLTYRQSKSTTSASTPVTTVTHRDQPFSDPRHRTPFELSSGLPSPDYPFTAPVGPTHIPEADPRLNARRSSLLESPCPVTIDRLSAPSPNGGCSGPGNLSTFDLQPRAGVPGAAQVSMTQPLNENGKRSFSAFSADDNLFVSPSLRSSDSSSILSHAAPYAKLLNPVAARAALSSHSCSSEWTQQQPSCPAIYPLIPTMIDRVCIPPPPADMKMVSQPPNWPKPPDASSLAPTFDATTTTATVWPLSLPPPPPALPRPAPGYVWTGSDWHGPFWTHVLPAHIAADNDNGSARFKGATACAKACANNDAGLED